MEHPGNPDPASQNHPQNPPNIQANHQSENQGICPGCQEPAEINDPTTCIPQCTHRFHEECLKPWFKKDSSCPICRSKINVYYLLAGRTVKVPKAKKGNKNLSRRNQGIDDRVIEYDSQQMGENDESYHQNQNEVENSEQSVIIFSSGEHSDYDLQNRISSGPSSQENSDEDSERMNSEEQQGPKRLRTRSRFKRLRRQDGWKLQEKREQRKWNFLIDNDELEQEEQRQKKGKNRGFSMVQQRGKRSLQRESNKGDSNIGFLNEKKKKKR